MVDHASFAGRCGMSMRRAMLTSSTRTGRFGVLGLNHRGDSLPQLLSTVRTYVTATQLFFSCLDPNKNPAVFTARHEGENVSFRCRNPKPQANT